MIYYQPLYFCLTQQVYRFHILIELNKILIYINEKEIGFENQYKICKKVNEISIHPNLPKTSFYMNIYASRNYGKSLLVLNLDYKFKSIF